MNSEAQCVALAKFQGWTSIQWAGFDGWIGKPPGYDILAPIPKYTSCMNAISEVEKLLSSERPIVISEFDPYTGDQYRVGASDKDVYFMHLRHLTGLYNHIDVFIAATAAQKAEAILKAIGWWKFCAYCGNAFSPLWEKGELSFCESCGTSRGFEFNSISPDYFPAVSPIPAEA